MTKRANGNASRRHYLRCRVEPGMFREEYLIVFEGLDPLMPDRSIEVQSLVDEKLVDEVRGHPERGRPVEGLLQVELVRSDARLAVVALPQPAIPVGDTAVVRPDRLVEVSG